MLAGAQLPYPFPAFCWKFFFAFLGSCAIIVDSLRGAITVDACFSSSESGVYYIARFSIFEHGVYFSGNCYRNSLVTSHSLIDNHKIILLLLYI